MLWNIKSFAQSWDFNYTGGVQSWTCPADGTYKLETWGAQGGSTKQISGIGSSGVDKAESANGGNGGYSSGSIELKYGQKLYIVIGGKGTDVSIPDNGSYNTKYNAATTGGYNGGGNGGAGCSNSSSGRGYFGAGTSGGGATHIATTNRGVLANYSSNRSEVLLVAGGGGGAGTFRAGGSGGGNTGGASSSGNNKSNGGTQTTGYAFGQGAPGDSGDPYSSDKTSSTKNSSGWLMYEGRGGSGGGWYGGERCTNHTCENDTNVGGGGGSGHLGNVQNGSMQNGVRSGNGFARITSMHTHNSSGTEYNQGNDNQHIKYTYCTGHGSDKSQNRSSGTLENHTWIHISNTQDQCTACKRTRTRTYWNDINIYHPNGGQLRDDGNYGWGYIKISNDGSNWSGEVTNENDMTANRTYGSRIYVKYIRPFYDYLEFGSITADGDIVSAGTNTWYHTVTGDSQSINIYMQYKHTTLTLDPNGGTINGNSSPQALSPQMQYSTSNWWDVSGEMPIRNGYTFEGWYDADDTKVYNTDGSCVRGTKYFDNNGNSLCVNDLTVYAHWKINTYNIYYTLYGSNASLQRTYTVESNNFALPTNPTLQGYTFKGWIGGIDQKDPVKKGNTYQTLTKNITISKGEYGDYFFRAIFEKTSSVDQTGNRTDNVYIAQSVPHEKQY